MAILDLTGGEGGATCFIVLQLYGHSITWQHCNCFYFSTPTCSTAIASINISISEEDVYNALINLDITKATDPDNIPPIVLSKCASVLCQPLHHLFSLSLKYGYLPTDWKIHKIIPIFKSGDPTLLKNYPPISLLSNTSKVLERIIIHDKIIDHNLLADKSSSIWIHEEPLHCTTANTISVQCLCFTPSVHN